MNVVFDRAVWSDPQLDPLALVSILAACSPSRHTLILDPRDRLTIDQWLLTHIGERGELRRRLAQILENSRRAAPHSRSASPTITVSIGPSDWTQARLSPAHAARLLQRPLKLLVENSRNDRAFLLRLAEPAARRALEHALREGWIEFEMGGGLQEIHHRVKELAANSEPEAMIARARLWVMFDRDAHDADRARESDASRRLRELAATVIVPWPLSAHQLERRAIENYVPLAALLRWWCAQCSAAEMSRRVERAQAFADLAPKIRHNFNMKRGLLGDIRRERREALQANGRPPDDADLDPLFRAIDPALRGPLSRGFDRLADAFSAPGEVRDNDLHDEVSPRERRRLVESILDRM